MQTTKIVFYVTEKSLILLLDYDQWLADATFFVCPSIFQKHLVLHGNFINQTSPLAFFRMAGVTQELY